MTGRRPPRVVLWAVGALLAAWGVYALGFAVFGSGSSSSPGAGTSRVDRCVERFLEGPVAEGGGSEDGLRRYVRIAYCERFDARGWVHDDGTLGIDAYRNSGACASIGAGGSATAVPCDVSKSPLDCALLHRMRRSEVQAFLSSIPKREAVVCDDGTPLADLGAS